MVGDIQERIKRINASIFQHEKAIQELQEQRRAAYGVLNDIRDPFARLPLELSSMVFERYVALSNRHQEEIDEFIPGPLTLLQICRSWTRIVLGTPSIWANIHLHNPPEYFWKALGLWLDRAKCTPVKIVISGCIDWDIARILTNRKWQFCHFEFRYFEAPIFSPVAFCLALEEIEAKPFPALETLILGTHLSGMTGVEECLQLLNRAPRVRECTLFGCIASQSGTDAIAQPRVHICLRQLHLGQFPWTTTANALKQLTLPALENLHISVFDMQLDEFEAFLTRSAPPLRTLRLGSVPFSIVSVCLLIPEIQNLDLAFREYDSALPILDALRTKREFLPNLTNLTVRHRWVWNSHVQIETLLSVLATRRYTGALQSLTLLESPEDRECFEFQRVQLGNALGGLVEDGMHIEIGVDREPLM